MSQIKLFLNKQNLLRPATRFMSDWVPKETVTHTGQKWSSDDYRLSRFIDRPKHVNKNFAINLIAEVPPKPCKERVVWCDGGSGPTGHPKVYINLDKPGNHSCGYCGLRFYKEDHH
ncbi:NADH dehydrogenase [ubiquinone] iron-sulfur protein 6, mitochondrial [Diorhabda carinulata]|uniref:NADH dehydrogenase [ubiquinone] iron-sulfur protein 6, mitochondrial n=1 Tax=Diorhabda sublineata TaxID=1163346 RepID=UPI0024E189B8|nr:NADH dehydrogenase [ubiquinone] iron-sulfur protein 6, mitochondrial [Diorhabda sublineata]XP_057651914.1 NADH dehydrogenase [ubiquinone] iron-sulfur protein 6, mitochondrial [Diorhabda carinulata]